MDDEQVLSSEASEVDPFQDLEKNTSTFSEQSGSSGEAPLSDQELVVQGGSSDEIYHVEVVNAVDYSGQMDNIQQVLVYQSGMIIVLCVLVVLFMGLVGGIQVTRWWRARN